mmetsp:Transcript_30437/g.54517  ORF Transcript_30437/g.54517 Transcript_30437/m.54517 type:complete len:271 (-) Transcript_30437:792-1604(-)
MSVSFPVLPSMPYVQSASSACLARSLVMVRITLAPQFCASVRGMTSRVDATARYAHCSVPITWSALSASRFDTAISIAPPPGTNRGSRHTFRATPIASVRLRSTSFRMSLDGPRSMMVQALGSAQSTMKEKYSSPIFFTSNSPAIVPTSSGRISSGRLMMVAPQARAMRLLSVLRSRRMALMPALMSRWAVRSESPFSVITTSGLTSMICAHTRACQSSSILSRADQSSSLLSSTLVWFSPFLYSRGQSSSRMRGFSILRRIRPGATTSF